MALKIHESKLHHIYVTALASSGDYSGFAGGYGTDDWHGAGSFLSHVTLDNE